MSDRTWYAHRRHLAIEQGQVRRERFDGREHLVVPVVPIVAGVLNDYYVPAEEIAAFVEAWNGLPLPIGHPTHDGRPISANTPQVLEGSIGRLFGAHMDGDRLIGELWLDIAKCHQLGGQAREVLQRVQAGQPLEVSTAFWADTEMTPGIYRGRPYQGIHRHLRPDHLALLPHDVGACSWADGCGAPRTHGKESSMQDQSLGEALKAFVLQTVHHLLPAPTPVIHVLSQARRPRFSGTERTAWTAPSFAEYVDALFEGDNPPQTVGEASIGLKRRIAAHTLLGDPEADTFRDLSFFPVVNPRTGRLNENALRAVIGGRGSQANIPQEARASAQRMARRLLNSEFDAELEVEDLRTHLTDADIREAVHAALAREQGTSMTFLMVEAIEGDRVIYREGERLKSRAFEVTEEGGIRLGEEITEVTRDTRFHPVEEPVNQQRKEGPMLSAQAQQHIAALIASQDSGWTEADRPLLEAMCEQTLSRLHAHMLAQQAAQAKAEPPKPATLDEWLAQLPAEPRELVTQALENQKRQRQEILDSIVQADDSPWTAEDLQALSMDQLLKIKRSLHRAAADYRAQGLPAAGTKTVEPLATPQTMARVLELQRQRGMIR